MLFNKWVVMRGFLLSLIVLFSFSAGARNYVINVSESLDNSMAGKHLEKYLTMAYQKVGITPEFTYYPSGRGLQKVASGELDADAGRLPPVMESYSGVIRVDEPLGEVRFGLFCLEDRECRAVEGAFYGRQSGSEMSQLVCTDNNLACIPVARTYDLAKLLEALRVSALLLPLHNAPEVLCQLNRKEVFYKTFPAYSFFSYHYLSNKNSELTPSLTAAIRDIKKNVDMTAILGNNWKTRLNACQVLLEESKSVS